MFFEEDTPSAEYELSANAIRPTFSSFTLTGNMATFYFGIGEIGKDYLKAKDLATRPNAIS